MKLAFCLFKYFPFGGLQRDFLGIASTCQARGHVITVFTGAWHGAIPPGFSVRLIASRGMTNHGRRIEFGRLLKLQLDAEHFDVVIGFNKVPGLDVYFAADPCYQHRMRGRLRSLFGLSPRYRSYVKLEASVFSVQTEVEILLLAAPEREVFRRYYHTPAERFHILPPGIARDRMAPANAAEIRAELRSEFGLGPADYLVLMVGSGFKVKGLDRALRAVATLPATIGDKTRLMVLGQDDPRPFLKLARRLGIAQRLDLTGGRADVPRFLLGADLLIHPAYSETAGIALLEALASGLPVLVSDVCGYAFHVAAAQAGCVIESPFKQSRLNELLLEMLTSPRQDTWRNNGLAYARCTDLFSMHARAAEIIEARALRNTEVNNSESRQRKHQPHVLTRPTPTLLRRWRAFDGQLAAVRQRLIDSFPFPAPACSIGLTFDPALRHARFPVTPVNRSPYDCLVLAAQLQTGAHPDAEFARIMALPGEGYRSVAGRETVRVALGGKDYFIKRHTGVGWGEIFKNLLQLRAPVLGAQNEWRAILRLNELHIATMTLAGYGSRGWNPARRHSFVMTEALGATVTLEDLCRNWPTAPPAPILKWALLARLAQIAKGLHENGINHRDFYLCHFLLDCARPLSAEHLQIYLIDLHRAQLRRTTPLRWVIRDLGALYFSALASGLTRRDLLRFVMIYQGLPLRQIFPARRALWARVERRALRLARRPLKS